MCGIAGIFSKEGGVAAEWKVQIQKMIAPLTHRGPDGWGIYCTDTITLGHARLSIIDLSGGAQPFITEDYVLSFNGEIYNYIELKDECIKKGAVFRTHSDTEVLLKTIEIFGVDGIKKFNGQYAFLLWNKKDKKLVTGRDRFGERPLYILELNNTVYFASEMKAFDTIPGFCREYDASNLLEHGLLWNTLQDQTVWKNIRSVEPGTFELFDYNQRTHKIVRYYSLGETLFSQKQPETFSDAQERLKLLLSESVRIRLRSDVPVGVYISGGIDSSVIAAITASIQHERFKTFSVTFSDQQYDESTYQNEMVALLSSQHASLSIDYDRVRDNYFEAVYHTERPLFRTAPVPLFLLSDLVRESTIKVVLTGEASDEILFGYDSFKELKLIKFWQKQPASVLRPLLIRKLYPHLGHYAESNQYGLMKTYYEDFLGMCDNEFASAAIRIANNGIIAHSLNKESGVSLNRERLLDRMRKMLPENYSHFSDLQKNQFTEMRTLLSGYLLSSQGDRMTMSHGVEGRYPFLDHTLIEEVFAWPDNYKLRGFEQKYALRKAYTGMIPDSIIQRPKLPYQAPDVKSFVRSEGVCTQAGEFLSERMIKEYGVFDSRFIERFMKKFSQGIKEQYGYRDNMLFAFILSAQMALYWAKNPKTVRLKDELKVVDISE
ncbi:MAG: asparagine synthase (glutamine-hydrolyzing) [Chitinispirillaceae bacterium]|nr:asparagine synthase (glutamine-hydrolyzing) [Chitinispirillaceae bacterium]